MHRKRVGDRSWHRKKGGGLKLPLKERRGQNYTQKVSTVGAEVYTKREGGDISWHRNKFSTLMLFTFLNLLKIDSE